MVSGHRVSSTFMYCLLPGCQLSALATKHLWNVLEVSALDFMAFGLSRAMATQALVRKNPLPADVDPGDTDVFGNPDNANYEWMKHGTCSGLDAHEYLNLVRDAGEAIVVSGGFESRWSTQGNLQAGAVKGAFLSANPRLGPNSIVTTCVKIYFMKYTCVFPKI